MSGNIGYSPSFYGKKCSLQFKLYIVNLEILQDEKNQLE